MKKISAFLKPLEPFFEKIEPFFEKVGSLSKAKRILICSASFLILIGSFVYFFYLPKSDEIDKLNKEYEKLDQRLTVIKNRARHLKRYRNDIKKAEAQFKIAMKTLPDKKEIPSLLTNISKSGQDAGLEFLLFQPKPEIKKDFYAEIPVSINVRGGYHNVALFFDKVARLSRIVNIRNINMVSPKNGRKLSTSCTAVTYRFVETPQEKDKQGKASGKKK